MPISKDLDIDSPSLNVVDTCTAFRHLIRATGQICGYRDTVVKRVMSNERAAVKPENTWLLPKVINGAMCHFAFIVSNDALILSKLFLQI